MSLTTLGDPIGEIYECRRDIEKYLKYVAAPSSHRSKRRRPDLTASLKTKDFEKKMIKFKKKFQQTLDPLFAKYRDLGVYDKLAYDIMKIFHSVEKHYNICQDNIYYALRCVVIPIIGEILDDRHIGKKAYDKQQLRKYFLQQLMNFQTLNQPSQVVVDFGSINGDISIDVCSDSPVPSREQSVDMSNIQVVSNPKPSKMTLEILDVLIEALGKQSRCVNDCNVKLSSVIHHTVNITYIIEIVHEYLDSIKTSLELEMLTGKAAYIDYNLLYIAIDKYEKDLVDHLENFDLDVRMTIFRDQLDYLLFQLITLKPLLKRR